MLLDLLYSEAPFDKQELLDIVATAFKRYKTYEIPKRNGRGTRTIAQPSPEVKLLQRLVVENVFDKWPIHEAAVAYRRRMSIATHAKRHLDSRFLLKLDFEDFFPSITARDIREYALRQTGPKLNHEDVEVLVRLVTWRNPATGLRCLSIGAPSSPSCSNSLLFDFDTRVEALCTARGVTYSRYADDLAFSTSTQNTLHGIEQLVRTVLNELPYPRLQLNESKTVNVSKRYRRFLVGLVLTPQGNISIGRSKKRQIRAAIHRFSTHGLGAEELIALRGMLAFVWSVEPQYIRSLIHSYGQDTMTLLNVPFTA